MLHDDLCCELLNTIRKALAVVIGEFGDDYDMLVIGMVGFVSSTTKISMRHSRNRSR